MGSKCMVNGIDNKQPSGALVLSDGTVFPGYSFGAVKTSPILGEVIFNTAMSGYQEIITDPSYYGQFVVMTYPQIGNYGINLEDCESLTPSISGLIVHDYSVTASNWRANQSLKEYLEKNEIPALCNVNTRALTQHIREKGAMDAILTFPSPKTSEINTLVSEIHAATPMDQQDLAAKVTCPKPYRWKTPLDQWHQQWRQQQQTKQETKKPSPLVVVLDFGCKQNILRNLYSRGCNVHVLPAQSTPEQILALKPNGLLLSNGPGNPAVLDYAIQTVRSLLGKMPIFGICMGHQILASAIGAKTYKMKFGHHGVNQPVLNTETGRIFITSQNHSYAIEEKSIPSFAKVTQINLNDKSIEGINIPKYNAFSVQYHPEASPGPRDGNTHFDHFLNAISQ